MHRGTVRFFGGLRVIYHPNKRQVKTSMVGSSCQCLLVIFMHRILLLCEVKNYRRHSFCNFANHKSCKRKIPKPSTNIMSFVPRNGAPLLRRFHRNYFSFIAKKF